MSIMIIALSVVGIAYLIVLTALLWGANASKKNDSRTRTDRPFVSVLVPARDEERTLSACLESLRDQTYPKDRYEVILVNDHSNDRTGDIAASFANAASNFRVVVPGESSHLTGRSNALAHGIDTAKGEVFLMTDADCVIPPTWVEETTKRFSADVGVVGGFRSIKNSVTEDFQLFKAVVNTGRWGFKFMLDPKTTNLTRACQSIPEIIEQKHRWGRGGLDLNWLGYKLVCTGFLMHALLVAGLMGNFSAALPWLGAKLAADAVFLFFIGRSVGRLRDLLFFPWFEVYFFLYVLLMPLRVLSSGNVAWKGRTYGKDHQPIS